MGFYDFFEFGIIIVSRLVERLKDNSMKKTKLKINGMSCQHCVKTVTDALTGLEGVQRAKVNLRKGEAVVHFNELEITTTNLREAITEAGFETL